jgi:hypothetical protein
MPVFIIEHVQYGTVFKKSASRYVHSLMQTGNTLENIAFSYRNYCIIKAQKTNTCSTTQDVDTVRAFVRLLRSSCNTLLYYRLQNVSKQTVVLCHVFPLLPCDDSS